jgi:Leucine-rich repeat (LRR) protein
MAKAMRPPLGQLIITSPENPKNIEQLRLQHLQLSDPEISGIMLDLLNLEINKLHEMSIKKEQRSRLLGKQLEYLHLHFQNLGNIKSVNVLKEIFE